jgi:hypothetical protein
VRRHVFNISVIVVLAGVFTLVAYWAIAPEHSPLWTGFAAYDDKTQGPRAKTLWDWLDLLIVPLFLSLAAWLLSSTEKAVERSAESNKRKQEALEGFFAKISELLLAHNLIDSSTDQKVRNLARNWSLVTFRILDGERKAEAMQFLYEAGLLNKSPIVNLNGADLRQGELEESVLSEVEIRGAYFNGARMRRAILHGSDFRGCNFSGVDLRGADLEKANLSCAILEHANLRGTDLRGTTLTYVDLSRTKVWLTKFSDGQLADVVLTKRQRLMLRLTDRFDLAFRAFRAKKKGVNK